jgi:hypothetical protein
MEAAAPLIEILQYSLVGNHEVKFCIASAFQEDIGGMVFLDGFPRLFFQTKYPLEFVDLCLIAGHDSDMVQSKILPKISHIGVFLDDASDLPMLVS